MKRNVLICISMILLFASCSPKRNLVYFSNMTDATTLNSISQTQVTIREHDIVSVAVNSQNPESNKQFAVYRTQTTDGTAKKEGYRVNSQGNIQLPFIGDFKIAGLTIEQAQINLTNELSRDMKNPVVNVQLLNFRVTVIGEVNKPGAFIVDDDQINLLEALGLAGDLTAYGKRENILLIRNESGKKTINRLNLNDKNTLLSPYFSLKQNDIIYVEPDRSKAFEVSKNARTIPMIIASISAAAVVAAVILQK
ncbi:MAG: sugar transporter [Pedobacter sp.]|nr:MAG: sugar transporter [Pedobacter sp.]